MRVKGVKAAVHYVTQVGVITALESCKLKRVPIISRWTEVLIRLLVFRRTGFISARVVVLPAHVVTGVGIGSEPERLLCVPKTNSLVTGTEEPRLYAIVVREERLAGRSGELRLLALV